jgi:dihydrofolate reductase
MTKTQYYTATSIDGFIADENNSLDWLFEVGSGQDAGGRYTAFFSQVGAMAMGSTTYQWVVEHGRLLEHPDKWRDEFGYGDTPCCVFTHRDLPAVRGAHLSFVRDDVELVHRQMREAADGKNIWIVGGGDLAGQFIDRGLLDEIILGVAPVTLGAGAPVLPRRLTGSALTLTAVEQDASFAYLTYTVAAAATGA